MRGRIVEELKIGRQTGLRVLLGEMSVGSQKVLGWLFVMS